ncbi:MAG: formylglycine-generating enzyme family protein [Bacteroidota bacterium]
MITRLLFTFILVYLGNGCSTTEQDSTTASMMLIPSGTFLMGGRSDEAYQNELPRHEVKISPFYMDKYEVTNEQFKEFADQTGYKTVAEKDIDWDVMKMELPPDTPQPPDSMLKAGSLVFKPIAQPVGSTEYWWEWTLGANWKNPEGPGSTITDRMNHPVVHISWEDATAFAEWAGKRLPTEAEWEWASSGGDVNVKYPWGNNHVSGAYTLANFWQGVFPIQNLMKDGYYSTAPVGSFPPNQFGLHDMGGNVWEWCSDKYDANSYKNDFATGTIDNPKGSDFYFDPEEPHSSKHIIRGGSFLCSESYCSGYRVSRRMSSTKDSGFNHTGFRCVRDID